MNVLKNIFLVLGILFVIGCILVLRPVPIVPEADCLVVEGIVTNIYEGGVKDANFRLKDQEQTFYFNRALENGLDLEQLRSQLLDKKVTIKYPKYWTPLDPNNSIRHASVLVHDGETLYTELN